jgi:hypothetical protein
MHNLGLFGHQMKPIMQGSKADSLLSTPRGLVLAPHKEPCRTALVAEALLAIYSHLTLRLFPTIIDLRLLTVSGGNNSSPSWLCVKRLLMVITYHTYSHSVVADIYFELEDTVSPVGSYPANHGIPQ